MVTPKVQAGDAIRLSATAWNSFIDAADANTLSQGGEGRPERPEVTIVRCKNDSTATIPRHSPVAVSGVLISPTGNLPGFQASPAFKITTTSATSGGRLGVSYEPIAAGQIGRVAFGGVMPCQVDIASTDDDIAVAHESSTTVLQGQTQGAVGLRILAREVESTLGEQWCLVELGEYRSKYASFYLGKLNGAITDATTTAAVDNLAALNGEALSDSSFTVNNGFEWSAADDANCLIGWNNTGNQWELLQVQC